MKYQIIEKCQTSLNEAFAQRTIIYNSDKENFVEALLDFLENFNFDNVEATYDDFDGECESSEIVSFERM